MDYTVIIPAYNASSTIMQAIASCLAQTMLPRNIIVVDDASQDNTAALVQGMNHPLVSLVRLPYNQGVSAARNTAWEMADTRYIAMLDSDDTWHPQKMEICAKYINKAPNDIWVHDFQYAPFEGNMDLMTKEYPISNIKLLRLLINNPIVTCSLIIPRNIALKYDVSMRYCEDHDLLLRLAAQHTIHYIDVPLSRVHRPLSTPGGLSGNRWEMRLGEMKMYAKLYKLHPLGILASPILIIYSLSKHICKVILGK